MKKGMVGKEGRCGGYDSRMMEDYCNSGRRIWRWQRGKENVTVATGNGTWKELCPKVSESQHNLTGDWVECRMSYPLYQSRDCRFLDDGFRCSENGRPDLFHTKWRWQPKACDLPKKSGNGARGWKEVGDCIIEWKKAKGGSKDEEGLRGGKKS
ncbi:Protein trichome birefringence-like 11 [Camellia lanceoleosa]|uniref:Protein trichome birefringence-like 11 n=1 Tax=Camellia lanceoleosa TaxID=1840588 RepID=A0ACC0GG83_9ERIC|nr:Protein trichome birefringence-like 11 [Camellia lanceoleosa]